MIHFNHAMGLRLYTKEPQHHMFLCTYLSKESAKQPASPLSSRHVHIANDDTKQLQDSKPIHVSPFPELASELTPFYEL